jgi:hypothetical protein
LICVSGGMSCSHGERWRRGKVRILRPAREPTTGQGVVAW